MLPPEQLATGCSGPAGPALGLVTAQTPSHHDAGSRNLAGGSFPALKILQAEKNQSPESQGRREGKEEAEDRGQEQMLEKLELALESKALSDKGTEEVCGMGCRLQGSAELPVLQELPAAPFLPPPAWGRSLQPGFAGRATGGCAGL